MSKHSKPRNKKNRSAEAQSHASQQDENVPHAGVSTPHLAAGVNSQVGPSEERNKPQTIEFWRFWLEIVTVALLFFGSGIYYFQMRANLRQASAAEQQLKDIRDAQRLDERAWVMPYDFWKTNGVYRVLFKNTGKTPAINVDTDIRCTMVINEVETAKWSANPPGPYSGVLGPNVEGRAETENNRGSYFFGRIWYDDIFGSNHWTDFCVYFWPTNRSEIDNTFSIRPFGNSTDDSKTKQKY